MNTINIFISCNENIQIFTRENTDVFITIDENIHDIHQKRVIILYLSYPVVCDTTHRVIFKEDSVYTDGSVSSLSAHVRAFSYLSSQNTNVWGTNSDKNKQWQE